MKRIDGPLRTAIVLGLAIGVGLLALRPAAAAGPGLDDRRAAEHLAAMEREGIETDPFWAEAYRARALTAPTRAARAADLRWALRFDPDDHGARRELIVTLFREGEPEFAGQCATLAQRIATSFPAQQWVLHVVFSALGPGLLIGLVLFALLAIGKSIPRIHHALRERLLYLPAEVREGATLLTLLLPLVLALTLPPTAAVFWVILLGTVGTWVLLDRWERRLAVAALAVLLVAPFGLAAWSRVSQPAFPDSYLRCLWVSQGASDALADGIVRVARPVDAETDPDWHATLALIDRRNGRWVSAAERLERAIELAPERWDLQNNLGNVRLLAGDVDGALAAYDRALALDPRAAVVHVNRSQARVRRLEFTKADADIRRASELGYHFPKLQEGNADHLVLRDHRLDAGAVWRRFVRGEGVSGVLPWRRALDMALGLLLPMRPAPFSLPLFLAIAYASLARGLHRTFPCTSCGRLVSRKSHFRVNRRSLCADCYGIRQAIKAPLRREELLADRRRRVRRLPRALGLAFSFLVPGAGQILAGSPRRGGFALVVSAALGFLAWGILRWTPVHAPLGQGGASGSLLVAVVLVYAAMAVTSARRYHRSPTVPGTPGPVRSGPDEIPHPRSA